MRIPLTLACLALACFIALGLNDDLRVVRYRVDAGLGEKPLRLALLTDLHASLYGDGQRILLDALNAEAPDAVLLGGDIFDCLRPMDDARTLIDAISDRYPCYFVTGNHEYMSGRTAFKESMALLKARGVTRLQGDAVTLSDDGRRVVLHGLDDLFAWGRDARARAEYRDAIRALAPGDDRDFHILLIHRPEYFDLCRECGFDLVLAGHTHGGQWRVPGLINGLYTRDQGLFPPLAGGLYRSGDTAMIVSRGLAKAVTKYPRFYDPPELVVVELD